METILLTIILFYLVSLEKANKRQNKVRKVEQYKESVGCYLFNF